MAVRARRRRHGAQMVRGRVHVYWRRVCVLRVARHHLIEVGVHLTAALVTHRRVTGARHHRQNKNTNCGARLKVVVARRRGAFGRPLGRWRWIPSRTCSQLGSRASAVCVGGCGGVVFVAGATAQLRCLHGCGGWARCGHTPAGLAAAGTGYSGQPRRRRTDVFLCVCGSLPVPA